MSKNDDLLHELLKAAKIAAKDAYCPYSKFRVGAAVSASGKIFTGCNIENASYGLTICAERVAIFKAVSEGFRKIEAIGLTCIDAPNRLPPNLRMPCGACRQVLAEFLEPTALIFIEQVGNYSLQDLLPQPFQLRPK